MKSYHNTSLQTHYFSIFIAAILKQYSTFQHIDDVIYILLSIGMAILNCQH